MIIVGWGKDAKQIAYMGLLKCNNCNNYSHFHLYEIANKIKLYFVPVAKFNKKYILGCSVCNSGIEIDEDKKNELIALSVDLPNEQSITEIWAALDKEFTKFINGKSSLKSDQFLEPANIVKESLKSKYSSEHIEYVIHNYFSRLIDQINAK